MSSTFHLHTPAEAREVAERILAAHPAARIFALHGDLGAGKTTLIKGFCEALGVTDATSSPSFALVNEYGTGSGDPVYHFDLYRLRTPRELEGIGFGEYLDSGHYCFIEWPELAGDLLPPGTLHVTLAESANGTRTITLTEGA